VLSSHQAQALWVAARLSLLSCCRLLTARCLLHSLVKQHRRDRSAFCACFQVHLQKQSAQGCHLALHSPLSDPSCVVGGQGLSGQGQWSLQVVYLACEFAWSYSRRAS
jgi:hypothetical protein